MLLTVYCSKEEEDLYSKIRLLANLIAPPSPPTPTPVAVLLLMELLEPAPVKFFTNIAHGMHNFLLRGHTHEGNVSC